MEYLAVFLLLVLLIMITFRNEIMRHHRARSYTKGKIVKEAKSKTPKPKAGLRWGNSYLPFSAATQHFFLLGTTGSGKSQAQRLLMRDALFTVTEGSDARALIFDAKGDTVAFLKKAKITAPVYSLNPFESRDVYPQSVAWDVGKDITSPAKALNLAASMIPAESNGSNQYFTNAARHILAGVLKSLIWHNAGQWSFSDLVYIILRRDLLRNVLDRDEAGGNVIATYLRDDKTGDDVYSTLCTHLSYYEPIAALWQRATKKLSIREWLDSNSILLLGQNSTASASLDVLNATLFSLFADEVDVMVGSNRRRIYVWIDEVREAASIVRNDGLRLLANKGRSRGVSLILAAQDLSGLYQAAGQERAEEILGQCSNMALLRIQSEKTANWAAKQIGQTDTIESFRSQSGRFDTSENISEQRMLKDAVLASEFFNIPTTSVENGLTGYFLSPTYGAERTTIRSQDIGEIVPSDDLEKASSSVSK